MNTTEHNGTITIACAFCCGQGRDPFGIMSPLSTCPVCGGTGECTLLLPVATCAYCKSTGIHPHTRLTCTSCGGAGAVHIAPQTETCPACKGSGRASDYRWPDSPLSCNVCRGIGVVSIAQAAQFRREYHVQR